jgi:hypothetical protein
MPCGQYCYQKKWQCQGGRLRQLTNVQKQPGPTRNYGSEGARENSIRRRVMSVKTNGSKTNYGPLFGGKKKPSVFSNCGFCGDRSVEEGKNVYYNNGGTSGTNTYWNKIAAGPKGTSGSGLGCPCGCPPQQILTIDLTTAGLVGWDVGAVITQTVGGNGTGIISAIASGSPTSSITVNISSCNNVFTPGPNVELDVTGGVSASGLQMTVSPNTDAHGRELCVNRLCGGTNGTTLLGGAPCSLGGKNWLNYRRFHPGAAKA